MSTDYAQIINDGYDPQTQTFTLALSDLRVQSLIDLFDEFVGVQVIQLTEVDYEPSSVTPVVNGIWVDDASIFRNLPSEVMFNLEPDVNPTTVQISITSGLTNSTWYFYQNFPPLRYTLADYLLFESVRLRLKNTSSTANDPSPLSFQGYLQPVSRLAHFFSNTTPEILTGFITSVDDEIPVLEASGQVLTPPDISIFELQPLSLMLNVAAHDSTIYDTKQPSFYVELASGIGFSAAPEGILAIRTDIFDISSDIQFVLDTTDVITTGLDAFSALLNGMSLDEYEQLGTGGNYRLSDMLQLSDFVFYIDPSEQTIRSIHLELLSEPASPWILLSSPPVQLNKVDVLFALENPVSKNSQNLSGAIMGMFTIPQINYGDAIIYVQASYSTTADSGRPLFEAYLDNSTPLSFKDMVIYFAGNSYASTLPAAVLLTSCSMLIEAGAHYALEATLADVWTLTILPGDTPAEDTTLSLEQVSMSIDYADTLTAHISANLQFATYSIAVSAAYENEGWQFSGSLNLEDGESAANLLANIELTFGVTVPDAIYDMTLNSLSVAFNTATYEFHFQVTGTYRVSDSNSLAMQVDLNVDPNDTTPGYSITADGSLTIDTDDEAYIFALAFAYQTFDGAAYFIGTYTHDGTPTTIPLHSFVATYLSASVAAWIPEDLELDVRDLLFGMSVTDTQSVFLFGLDVEASINLSKLPLIGQQLPDDETIYVDNLQVVVASGSLAADDMAVLNGLIVQAETEVTPLPTDSLEIGASIQAAIRFGQPPDRDMSNLADNDHVLPLQLVLDAPDSDLQHATPDATPQVVPADDAKWFNIQKNFGPAHFERLGVSYSNNRLLFLLDASLEAGGLGLEVRGLGVGASLSDFQPVFSISGLGLDYAEAGLEIGGELLVSTLQLNGETFTDYEGAAVINAEAFSLSAIGAYALLDEGPSLFVYAALNAPLGGVSFFFVTGISAGFGYNRRLYSPGIADVLSFPLVQEVVNPGGGMESIDEVISSLQQYVPPSIGDVFVAAGIKFTSFKLLDSFALVTLTIGKHLELDILGLSTAIIPPATGDTASVALAELELAIKASFVPDDGVFSLEAQLTKNSFLLSRSVHLSGGFAFYAWFSGTHQGDFVLSVGGYSDTYDKPAHYPVVPRVGFSWKYDDNLSFKGGVYFALLPSLLMAGGTFEATWKAHDLSASFTAGVDLFLGWKPYHYEAAVHVDVYASYTFHVFGTHTMSLHAGASLDIVGPEFSGEAHIEFSVISFDVEFGNQQPQLTPLSWSEFAESFLPADTEIINVAPVSGLLQRNETGDGIIYTVDPRSFSLTATSAIPANATNEPAFGVAPMGVKPGDVASSFTLTIVQVNEDGTQENYATEFDITAIESNLPRALWGEDIKPTLNDDALIDNLLTGYRIAASVSPLQPDTTPTIDADDLESDTFKTRPALQTMQPFQPETLAPQAARDAITNTINNTTVSDTRNTILSDFLGDTPDIDLNGFNASTFIRPPAVEDVESA